jgi:hypothetical protein
LDSINSLRHYFRRYTIEVESALDFLEWLQSQTFDLGHPSIPWAQPGFRIVYGDLDPLSIAGSLAAGGRFNIGGAQVNHFFSLMKMEACLYAASSLKCAKKEVGEPLGNARFFALKPQQTLYLWDLRHLILNIFHYKDLEAHVNGSPLAAIWRYQKVPKISQLIASFLRKQGGDGLAYPSTKDPLGQVLAFFVKDDKQTHQLFKASELFC